MLNIKPIQYNTMVEDKCGRLRNHSPSYGGIVVFSVSLTVFISTISCSSGMYVSCCERTTIMTVRALRSSRPSHVASGYTAANDSWLGLSRNDRHSMVVTTRAAIPASNGMALVVAIVTTTPIGRGPHYNKFPDDNKCLHFFITHSVRSRPGAEMARERVRLARQPTQDRFLSTV